MSIGTVFVSDRGDMYLPACQQSLSRHAPDTDHWPSTVIDDRDHRLGMAGAVRAGFEWALESDLDFVLWVEEDFLFTTRLPWTSMATILSESPDLAQVVLKRQPWSPEERRAGGIIESHPDDYEDRQILTKGGHANDMSFRYMDFVEHRRIFSLNPCLIPADVLRLGWPDGNEAEFTHLCLGAGYRFAFYGRRDDAPRVQHVGATRSTGWRL